MILGLGIDLCDICRFGAVLERHGPRFLDRCFTPAERLRAEAAGRGRVASYAKRFAAKEACAKALGTGVARGVFWRDMGVVDGGGGRPCLVLTGGAAERLRDLLPPDHVAVIHLTLTDEHPHAMAQVLIEARPAIGCPIGPAG